MSSAGETRGPALVSGARASDNNILTKILLFKLTRGMNVHGRISRLTAYARFAARAARAVAHGEVYSEEDEIHYCESSSFCDRFADLSG